MKFIIYNVDYSTSAVRLERILPFVGSYAGSQFLSEVLAIKCLVIQFLTAE